MSQKLGIFQFNGCNKCFSETLMLSDPQYADQYGIARFTDPAEWDGSHLDKAIISGFLLPENQEIVEKIKANSDEVIAFGSCSALGGIYGLNYQKGIKITPLKALIDNPTEVTGCLGEITTLHETIQQQPLTYSKNLCDSCLRKSTCDYLDEVHRQYDIYKEEEDKCYNDFGVMCTGYIAKECKERCVDFGTPCRGCKPSVERSGFRMIGLFSSLMANVEVASEPTGKGGTDKLADDDDDITAGNPDNTGNFFRHTLADVNMPIGRQVSTGDYTQNIFVGRAIEELPIIAGSMGGSHAISLTLDIVDALEQGLSLEIPDKVAELRTKLKNLEPKLKTALNQQNCAEYEAITTQIRQITGNMNLSNVYFGGFKVPIANEDNFDSYKYQTFEVQAGTFKSGGVEYSLDTEGMVTNFKLEVKT